MKLRSLSLSTSVEVKNGDQNMVILPIRKGSVSQITSHFEVNTHNLKEKYLFTCIMIYIFILIGIRIVNRFS